MPDFSRSTNSIERMLQQADRVGPRAVVRGSARIINAGSLTIGADFFLGSSPAESHIVTGPNAAATFGDDVKISYGAAISCKQEVVVGSGTRIGPFCVIHDSDFHVAGRRGSAGATGAIRIGQNVTIGTRVTIMRDSEIGDGAVVESGSVVSGRVPAGATVGGVPARIRGGNSDADQTVAGVVAETLGMAEVPDPATPLSELPKWESLNALNVMLQLEERFDVVLQQKQFASCNTIQDIEQLVEHG